MAYARTVDGQPVETFVEGMITTLRGMENVEMRSSTMGAGVYDHGYALGYERRTDDAPGTPGPRHASRATRATSAR